MSAMTIIGTILIVLGVVELIYGGITDKQILNPIDVIHR